MKFWNFPFDIQRCSLNVETFRYVNRFLGLTTGFFDTESFMENDQWEVKLGNIVYEELVWSAEGDANYDRVYFEFIFRRKVRDVFSTLF